MALVMTNIGMSVDGVTLARSARAALLTEVVEERTRLGIGAKWRTVFAGTRLAELQVEWLADYDRQGVYRTIHPLLGKNAEVRIWPNGGTPSASSPEHIFEVLVSEFPDISAAYGQLSTFTTTWPVTGQIISRPGPYWDEVMTVAHHRFNTNTLVGWQKGNFGSITEDTIRPGPEGPTNYVPGGQANVDLDRLYFVRPDVGDPPADALEVRFDNDEDARHIRDDFMVLRSISGSSVGNELILPLSPFQTGLEYYRSSAANPVADPGWAVGDRVRIEFWNGDPR